MAIAHDSHFGWIKRQQAKFAAQARQSALSYISGETHFPLSVGHRLRGLRRDGAPKISIARDRLELVVPSGSDRDHRERVMQRWQCSELRERAHALVTWWVEAIALSPPAQFILCFSYVLSCYQYFGNVLGGMFVRRILLIVATILSACSAPTESPVSNAAAANIPRSTGAGSSAKADDSSSIPNGRWEEGAAMMGTLVYYIDDGRGNHFGFECSEAGNALSITLEGKELPSNAKISISIDGTNRNLVTDDSEALDIESKLGSESARSIWKLVRGGHIAVVSLPDGKRHAFSLRGANEIMGKDFCSSNEAGEEVMLSPDFRMTPLSTVDLKKSGSGAYCVASDDRGPVFAAADRAFVKVDGDLIELRSQEGFMDTHFQSPDGRTQLSFKQRGKSRSSGEENSTAPYDMIIQHNGGNVTVSVDRECGA